MLEYARMLLEEADPRAEKIQPLLEKVLDTDDPAAAMEAQFLLGELAFVQGLYTQAANAFLKAALIDPANRDLAAYSLLRAAEMLAWAGREKEVMELVERLEANFPGSQWVNEGKRLLEEMK
jgi:tetratricopeptide (TPR) repeat protein